MSFQFVVMEHHAARAGVHFDLRFRMPGSMKWASFAVRKGIPLEPGIKVLAVRTTDHTEREALFTGNIRTGYGAGKLIKWDSGFCEVEKYSKEKIILTFRGKKVKGLYYLIQVGSDKNSNQPTYLLFKGNVMKEVADMMGGGMSSRNPPQETEEVEVNDEIADKQQTKPLPWSKGENNVVNKISLKEVQIMVNHEQLKLIVDQEEAGQVEKEIIGFFSTNPSPKDEEVHTLADRLKLDPHAFESHIYSLLGSFLGAGRSKDFKGSYDPEQIKMGIEVEKEHTTNPAIAERIAKDHLSENPKYYTYLKKMESNFEK